MNLPAHIQARLRVPDIPAYDPAPRWDTGCRHVVLLVLDGVGRQLFDSVSLPNLDALRSRGADFSHCLTTTPTITGSAHTSIHSGSYPETHRYGFPFWVKDNALVRPPNGKLGFEGFVSHSLKQRGMSSAAVSDGTLKGAFYSLYAEGFVGHSIRDVGLAARETFARWRPNYLTVTFYATDTLSHWFGPDHEYVVMALRDIDEEIGRLANAVAEAGLLEETVFIITSDHGLSPASHKVNASVDERMKQGDALAPNMRAVVSTDYPTGLLGRLAPEAVDRVLDPDTLAMLGFQHDEHRYVLCMAPGYTYDHGGGSLGDHGGFTEQERRVVLFACGPGIVQATFDRPVELIDIAPTVSGLLGGAHLASYQGRMLSEIVGEAPSEAEKRLTRWRVEREQRLAGDGVLTAGGDETTSTGRFARERRAIEAALRIGYNPR